jgi:hypothetical protein
MATMKATSSASSTRPSMRIAWAASGGPISGFRRGRDDRVGASVGFVNRLAMRNGAIRLTRGAGVRRARQAQRHGDERGHDDALFDREGR